MTGNKWHGGTPPIERVLPKLEWQGKCLVFAGSCDDKGYGQVEEGLGNGKRKNHKVHRVVYANTIGPIPAGMEVMHSCDNPPCSNPDHLSLGTHLENMKQMKERGRAGRPNSDKTHCPKGHPYDSRNTYVKPSGARVCKKCRRLRAGLTEEPLPPKTHCKHDHEYNATNTRLNELGRRVCLICQKDTMDRYNKRHRI